MTTTAACPYCNKTFKVSGLQVHITRAHAYDLWKAQQARKATASR